MSGIGRKMVHGKFDVSEGLQRAGHVDVPPSWICAAKIVSRCVPHCESCCGSSVLDIPIALAAHTACEGAGPRAQF